MKVLDFPQRSPEWYAARCGLPTASEFSKIVTTKGAPSEQRKKYLYRLAGERITGIPETMYQNEAMARGCEMEDEARQLYQIVTDREVVPIGFCLTDDGFGASPDGFVGEDGMIEIKCPNLATHVGYLIDNTLPSEYFQQVHGGLLATGRRWCDFVSYYAGIKPFIVRVERENGFHKILKEQLASFCTDLESVYQKLI